MQHLESFTHKGTKIYLFFLNLKTNLHIKLQTLSFSQQQSRICSLPMQNGESCKFNFNSEPFWYCWSSIHLTNIEWGTLFFPTPDVLRVTFQIEIFEYMLSDYSVNQLLSGRVIISEWHHLSDQRGLTQKQTHNSQTWGGRHGRPSGSSSDALDTLHL